MGRAALVLAGDKGHRAAPPHGLQDLVGKRGAGPISSLRLVAAQLTP
jgi:hypothetical protein